MNTAHKIYSPDDSLFIESEYDFFVPEKLTFDSCEGSSSDQNIMKKLFPTASDGCNENDPPEVAIAPQFLTTLKGRYKPLQMWEGRVVEVRETDFDAIIDDKTNADNDEELVTIDKSDVTPDDVPLLVNGAVFYWSIGYVDYPGRGRTRESKIRFRRLKGWTKKEIDLSIKIGKDFAEFFRSNSI